MTWSDQEEEERNQHIGAAEMIVHEAVTKD